MSKLTMDMTGIKGIALGFAQNRDGSSAEPNLRYLASEGQMVDGVYNPFRKYGYLCPANDSSKEVKTASSSVTTKFHDAIYDEINDDIYIADDTDLWKGDTLLEFDFASAITYSSGVVTDLDIYKVNDVRKLFTVYRTGGNMEIGISNLPYDTGTDDLTWLTSTVSGQFTNACTTTPFMRVSNNSFAYLFQDQRVHEIDGTSTGGANGTIRPDVFLFPPSTLIVDALDVRSLMFICIEPSRVSSADVSTVEFVSDVGVYIWNKKSTVLNIDDFIPLTGVKKIKRIFNGPDGDIRVITVSAEQILQLRTYTGSTFRVIAELGYQRADPTGGHDTFTISNGMVMWLGRDGYIYGYGRINPNEPEAQYKLGRYAATASTNNSPTLLFFGDNTYNRSGFYIAYNVIGNEFLQKWYLNGISTQDNVTQLANQGDVYTPVKIFQDIVTVNNVQLFVGATSTNDTTVGATIKVYFNRSATVSQTYPITYADTQKGYVYLPINKAGVYALQFEVEFNTTATLGDDDFALSHAVVTYNETTKKK